MVPANIAAGAQQITVSIGGQTSPAAILVVK
jgi:phage gp45-like